MKRILAVVAAGVLVAAVIGFGPAFACDKAKAEGATVAKADAKEGCPMAKGQDGAKSDGAGCPKAAATVANANGAAAAKPCGAAPAAVGGKFLFPSGFPIAPPRLFVQFTLAVQGSCLALGFHRQPGSGGRSS